MLLLVCTSALLFGILLMLLGVCTSALLFGIFEEILKSSSLLDESNIDFILEEVVVFAHSHP